MPKLWKHSASRQQSMPILWSTSSNAKHATDAANATSNSSTTATTGSCNATYA